MKSLSHILYILVAAAFFALIGDTLFTQGMFMDGLIYSNVANNLADGVGSFWHLSYTQTQFHEFYEHPPLAMGLCSLFYSVLGSGVWVGRLYSMFMTLISAFLIVRLWTTLGFERRTGWLPLLFWILVPAVSLNSHENMLECTMGVFVLLAVILMLRGKWWRMVLAGLSLLAAFLSKGFTGLYPLALPFVLFLFRDRDNAFTRSRAHGFQCALHDTSLVLVSLLAGFGLTCLLCRDAWPFLTTYFQGQVFDGINSPTADSRLHIVVKFFEETAFLWIILVLNIAIQLIWWYRRKRGGGGNDKAEQSHPNWLPAYRFETVDDKVVFSNIRISLWLAAFTLCGVLPIMVSLKQRSFYILTVYPFMACSVAVLMQRQAERLCDTKSRPLKVAVASLCAALCVVAVSVNVAHAGRPGRDDAMLNDMKQIAPLLEKGEVVSVSQNMSDEYSLQGYYYMERRISLDPYHQQKHLLLDNEEDFTRMGFDSTYTEIPLNTTQYKLYKRYSD